MRVIAALLFLSVISCGKQYINTSDVLYDLKLTPATVDADGSSIIEVTVNVNKDADAGKRKVVFETTAGSFADNGNKTITVEAIYESSLLVARAKIKAPSAATIITVSATPEIRNPYNDFTLKATAEAINSPADSIKLTASAFSVSAAYIGEVQITGILKNKIKKANASSGVTVLFEENPTTIPVSGRFRPQLVNSDEASKVSTFYSSGTAPVGSSIYVRATIIDKTGAKTAYKDSVLINVIP